MTVFLLQISFGLNNSLVKQNLSQKESPRIFLEEEKWLVVENTVIVHTFIFLSSLLLLTGLNLN